MGTMTRNALARRIVLLLGIAGASTASLGLGAVLIGLRRFDRLVRRDVDGLLARGAPLREGMIVSEEMLEDLPEPVRRYLGYTGVVGKPFVSTVRLEQRGTMYLGMDQGWVALDANQHYTVEPPAPRCLGAGRIPGGQYVHSTTPSTAKSANTQHATDG